MSRIKTWPQFAKRIRKGNLNLLQALPEYNRPIFVAGCQRSGGTMLARAITGHPEIGTFSWSKDSELDAAILLSGTKPAPDTRQESTRYCFQTTYLNERAVEYLQYIDQFQLIWLVRNPYSVVYSMLYNWKRFALNEVFLGCGLDLLPTGARARYDRFGLLAIRPLDRACYAWLGKLKQCEMLLENLPAERMTTLNYEDLVQNKSTLLNQLYDFAGLAPQTQGDGDISTRSMNKSRALAAREKAQVEALCEPSYAEHLASSIRLHS